MIHCPDWKTLLEHRFDPSLDEPEDWPQAFEHLESCEQCRIEAYGGDPSLLFVDLPALEVGDAEIRQMQQAVTTLRQGLELAKHDSSEDPGRRPQIWSWSKIAAALVVTGGLLAGALGISGPQEPAVPEVSAEGSQPYPLPSWEVDRYSSLPSTLPANWQEAPVVEEVGGPLTRIYNYPTAPDAKMALVMVIDPALDV